MPVLAARPRRLALACAMISVVALGTVSASAATATGSTSTPSSTTPEPARGGHASGLKYEPTDKAPDDVNKANDDFAACMRDADQTVFPSFHAVKDDNGEIRLETKPAGGRDDRKRTEIAGFREALEKCAPIMEKAGITFPDEDELPDHPKLPGQPGDPGHQLPDRPDCGVITRTEPGQTQRS